MPSEQEPRLRALAEAATPGEWAWQGNSFSTDLRLATVNRGRQYVMGFERWGMRGAQPYFRSGDRMRPACDLLMFEVGNRDVRGAKQAKEDGSVYRMDICGVDAPDAHYIAAANPTAIIALLDEMARLRAALKSIAANTCCDRCQEAALVARAALAPINGNDGGEDAKRT